MGCIQFQERFLAGFEAIAFLELASNHQFAGQGWRIGYLLPPGRAMPVLFDC